MARAARVLDRDVRNRGRRRAAALAFARSLGDFGVTLMVAGNIPGRTQTVAVAIYDAVESGNNSLALTLVIVVSVLALIILTIANRLEPAVVRR